MKTTTIYLTLIIVLSSCGMSNNFTTQKFTKLKQIKEVKTNESKDKPELSEVPTQYTSAGDQVVLAQLTETSEEFNFDPQQELTDDQQDNRDVERTSHPEIDKKEPVEIKHLFNEKEDKVAANRMLTLSTVLFWIGICSALFQLAVFVCILITDISVIFTFTWIGLMWFSLAAGFLTIFALAAAFITAMVYKKRAKRPGVKLNRPRWYSIWISSLVVGAVFLGNLLFTLALFVYEFFA